MDPRKSHYAMTLARRDVITFGAAVALGRVIAACASKSPSLGDDFDDAGAAAGNVGDSQADALLDASASDGAAAEAVAADSAAGWATGGTAAMIAKQSYPNPFSGAAAAAACVASCELTQGPCYSSQSVEIQDISYGYDGLPMRVYLRVLDESCAPIQGATVDVWHVGPTGKYSGNDSANEQIAFCTGNDSDFTSHLYFRGKQTTDSDGIVFFDTCFPGWYSSRTIHVHVTIRMGEQAYVTTQLGFDDALDDAIVASQPLYDARGARDTKNTTDTVLPSTGLEDYLFQVQRMSDGAMLAWKTFVLRSALSEALCSPAGAMAQPGGEGGLGGPVNGDGAPPGFPGDGTRGDGEAGGDAPDATGY